MSATLDRLGEGVEPKEAVASETRPRRRDVQGLRAVAVLLVVLYHCGVPGLGGGYVGVDVFLVISGFLITSHLLDELGRTGRVSLLDFYARRARRLLPPALLVVATTVVVARLWGPTLQSARTSVDGLAALLYAMNYRLAGQGVDYQLAGASPSPLQHFWSLAVEEQFYLLWPLCLVVVGLVTTLGGRRHRRALTGLVVVGVVLLSLQESVSLTASDPPLAYFGLQTRAWELGVGALLACALPLLARFRRRTSAAAGALTWAGLAMIGFAAGTFTDRTPFPGTAALWPVLGAALVLGGGALAPAYGVERALRGRLVQLVGDVSYGWYLWHWPALVLAPSLFGHALTLLERLEVSLLALWLAVLTHLLLERTAPRSRMPLRRWLGVGVVLSLLCGLVVAAALQWRPVVRGDGDGVAAVRLDGRGLAHLRRAFERDLDVPVPANLRPALARASADVPPTSVDGCHVPLLATSQPTDCVFGDPNGARTMVLFGDSHAEQWFSAVDRFARSRHYRMVSWTKVACPLANVRLVNDQLGRSYSECDRWRSARLTAIEHLRPAMVVASQADTLAGDQVSDGAWGAGTAATLRRLAAATPDLVLLADTPHAAFDPAACLSEHLDHPAPCNLRPHDDGRTSAVAVAASHLTLTRVDPTPWFCLRSTCPAVVGNAMVYRDRWHMTQAWSRTLAPLLRPVLTASTTANTARSSS